MRKKKWEGWKYREFCPEEMITGTDDFYGVEMKIIDTS